MLIVFYYLSTIKIPLFCFYQFLLKIYNHLNQNSYSVNEEVLIVWLTVPLSPLHKDFRQRWVACFWKTIVHLFWSSDCNFGNCTSNRECNLISGTINALPPVHLLPYTLITKKFFMFRFFIYPLKQHIGNLGFFDGFGG